MGSEIHKNLYQEEDYKVFEAKWLEELEYVRGLFSKGTPLFSNTRRIGYELEACILDLDNQPAPCNKAILDTLNSPEFTSELANYDLEINGSIFPLDGNALLSLKEDIHTLWKKAEEAAHACQTRLGLFGVFPSLTPEHFDRKRYQSEMKRYTMASKRIHELRHESIKLLFSGEDVVSMERNDVMSEALSTSLQIHLQVPFEGSVDYYHAALIASVVMVGVGANSPLVIGKRAWHESRIPIFEQSVDARDEARREKGDEQRVHFAQGYINSWLELFEQNRDFKILFPDVVEREGEKLYHLNLHNGTIWRWVRPILSRNHEGKITMRMELRVLPSGPTLVDSEANIWFFIGLIEGLVQSRMGLTKIPFERLKNDFYRVAKYGLETTIDAPEDAEKVLLKEWILTRGLTLAAQGLASLSIIGADAYLAIIRSRVENGQTGAAWQLKHYEKYHSIERLVETYMRHFEANSPVHTWGLDAE